MPTLDRAPRLVRTAPRETGAAAVEFVLVAPVVVLVFLLLVQWTVRLHAERAVDAAAREGAVAAARWDGSAQAGESVARDYLTRLDPNVGAAAFRAHRGAEVASVQVRGDVLAMVPFLHLRVSSTAEQPVERFVP
jgi:Flp pilus assembly protein TadG